MSATYAQIAEQKSALDRQEQAIAAREAETQAQLEASRRARTGRNYGRLLLANDELGIRPDEQLPTALQATLG